MKIKDQAIRELEELRPRDLLKVYDLIISLKERPDEGKTRARLSASEGQRGVETMPRLSERGYFMGQRR
jgi:hypothetical protein